MPNLESGVIRGHQQPARSNTEQILDQIESQTTKDLVRLIEALAAELAALQAAEPEPKDFGDDESYNAARDRYTKRLEVLQHKLASCRKKLQDAAKKPEDSPAGREVSADVVLTQNQMTEISKATASQLEPDN